MSVDRFGLYMREGETHHGRTVDEIIPVGPDTGFTSDRMDTVRWYDEDGNEGEGTAWDFAAWVLAQEVVHFSRYVQPGQAPESFCDQPGTMTRDRDKVTCTQCKYRAGFVPETSKGRA